LGDFLISGHSAGSRFAQWRVLIIFLSVVVPNVVKLSVAAPTFSTAVKMQNLISFRQKNKQLHYSIQRNLIRKSKLKKFRQKYLNEC